MKERPILFSAPMVRAILEGRKSQTRRVVKLQPRTRADIGYHGAGRPFIRNPNPLRSNLACPYGEPGDRLWVREAHRLTVCACTEACRGPGHVYYEADGSGYQRVACEKLRPGIHMHRWASRVTLEVTGVRVERLQDISEADAVAEGVESDFASPEYAAQYGALCGRQSRYGYAKLWTQINGRGSWDANPWVWVVEFKRIEGTP